MTQAETEKLLHGIDNKVTELSTQMGHLAQAAARTEHILSGNGKPGLIDEMQQLRVAQMSCPARAAFSDTSRKLRREDAMIWLALVSLLISLVLAIHTLSRRDRDEHGGALPGDRAAVFTERAAVPGDRGGL